MPTLPRGMCALTQTCTALRDVERQLGFRAICWPAICAREWVRVCTPGCPGVSGWLVSSTGVFDGREITL
jgi:hypothetical protein